MDKGRELADKELLKLERSLSKEYATAKKEMKAKYNEFTRKVDKKDEEKRALLAKGAITKTDYDEWRANQTYRAKWFKDMIRTLAKDQTAVNKRAAAIINGTTSGVYAEQFNYGTYMVEKAAKVDTAFTLYDKGAVRNLNAKAEIKVTKDIAWNNRKINSALMQGILQGESIPDIANRLAKIPDMNAGAAVRNARTLMTSAENEGRLDSFERAANMGINLKKTWVATLDDRVRESHAELDGETVPIDEPFSNGLMYPADPSGDDPAQVYNCRCTMITQIDGFERDVTDLDIRPAKIGSYEEWKAAHAGKPAEEGFFADRIKRIMAEKGTSEEAVYECGKVFADEMERSYFKPMRDELDDAERAFNEMSDKLSKYTQEQSDINEELMNHYLGNKVLPEKVEIELFERAEKLGKKIGAIINSNKYTEAEKRLDKAKDALSVHNYKKHADMLAEKLKNIREVGSDGLDIKSHLNNSRSPVRKFV